MSEWSVRVVTLGETKLLPNSDTLSITFVDGGYPCIFKTGQYKEGDKVVYVPIDSTLPSDDPRWDFLDGHLRVKARRLRGTFSLGLLTEAQEEWEIGRIVDSELNITKWEPPIQIGGGGEVEYCPFSFPTYTDIEGLRKYPNVLKEGEEVAISEKIHGMNARFVYHGDRIWVGSHKQVKKEEEGSVWWRIAKDYTLSSLLSEYPDVMLFGEVYGWVQDLRYGASPGQVWFRAFDALDLKTRKYFDWIPFRTLTLTLGIPIVPALYVGPWDAGLVDLYAEKNSEIGGGIAEGVVVKPTVERFEETLGGRCILKYAGQRYLLRKGG